MTQETSGVCHSLVLRNETPFNCVLKGDLVKGG